MRIRCSSRSCHFLTSPGRSRDECGTTVALGESQDRDAGDRYARTRLFESRDFRASWTRNEALSKERNRTGSHALPRRQLKRRGRSADRPLPDRHDPDYTATL